MGGSLVVYYLPIDVIVICVLIGCSTAGGRDGGERAPLCRLLIIGRPRVLTLQINLLATPTFITHEPRQRRHVTSSWHPL